jgi:cytochrome P450
MPVYPPGPANWAALSKLGDLGKTTEARLEALTHVAKTYGDMAHVHFLGRHYYLLNHPDLVKEVLVEKSAAFHKAAISIKPERHAPPADQLATLREGHRRQRRLIQPVFTPGGVSVYGPLMIQYTTDMLASWQNGQARNVNEDMVHLTLRIVAQTLFSADITDARQSISEAISLGMDFLSNLNRPLRTPIWLPTGKNMRLWRAWGDFDKAVKTMIATRRAPSADLKEDLLGRILAARDEQGTLSDEDVYGLVLALLIAGHETTATAMTWLAYLLAAHPQAQQRLYDEVRLLTFFEGGALAPMPYTEAVVREAMRLYPPAWVLYRLAASQVEIGGYVLPRDANVIFSPYLLHRDARFYDHPEAFTPERWLEGLAQRLPTYAYYPFGGGAHICTGQFFAWQEMALLTAVIGQRVQFMQPPAQMGMQPLITLRPDRPMVLSIQYR